jgi:hypothetical protein
MNAAAPAPAEFMATTRPGRTAAVTGNTPWARGYAAELERIVLEQAARAPRTLQQHLGPSEIGAECDRQVVGKMAALPATNHVVHPWPSIVGTAVHAWLADALLGDNQRGGYLRWLVETRVTPHPDHPGTGDAYDALEQAVVDWKILGETTAGDIRMGRVSRRYEVQLLLYGLGFLLLGLPVRRVALAMMPRTKADLSTMYVWERPVDASAFALLEQVFAQATHRRQLADRLLAGQLSLLDIAPTPDDHECYFCPFYRPQAARDSREPGCPGTLLSTGGGAHSIPENPAPASVAQHLTRL